MIVLSHAFSISGFALGGASYDCRLVATSEYDTASDTFRPGNESDSPPQERDAKCGFACHTIVQSRDYVFAEYGWTSPQCLLLAQSGHCRSRDRRLL